MKGFKVFIAAMVIGGLLQSCSTMEITQSRYGNGIGIAFDNGKDVNEHDADHFRNRKSDEANHKKWMQQAVAVQSRQTVIQTTPDLEFENLLSEAIPARENIAIDGSIIKSKDDPNTFMNAKTALDLNQPIDVAKNEANPVNAEKTTGSTSNLGYLGGILIIVGLIFFLLGYPVAITLVALGVLLVVLAYFLG